MMPLEDRIRSALAGRYRVERELGQGGMARVFLATDLRHERSVAVKVLLPELSAVLGTERFQQEIAFAARLQHPHILPLIDSGTGDGLMYYVMPFVEGESLRDRLDRERQLPLEEALRLAGEIARALDHAHRQGVVHRDIKPENILLADGQAMVADFGLARALRAAGGSRITQSGMTLGTPPYMSPEQVSAASDLDARSDLYSLGCVLYEMVAGQPPFTGSAEALAHQHLNVQPRPVSELRPAAGGTLDAIVMKALAKTPADRFSSAAEMAAALRGPSSGAIPAWSGGATPGAPVPGAVPPDAGQRPARRSRTLAVVVAVVVVAIAAGLWRFGPDLMRRFGSASHAPGTRQWVWFASFEGPADDPSLAPTTRDLVAAALDQSDRVATVPEEQVRIALRNARLPDTIRVDPALARQLAWRSSIPVVVEGRVGRIGSAYAVVLKATRAGDGDVILTVEDQARDESDLVPTLAKMARRLRGGLGERVADLRPDQLIGDAPTPSFEAFRLYVKGRQLNNGNDPYGAIVMLRRAIAVDPDFATAWVALGTAYGNCRIPDSAWVSYQEALKRPDRLAPVRRFDVEAKLAGMRGDYAGVLAAYDAVLKLDPTPAVAAEALNNMGATYSSLGQNERAVETYQRAVRTWPVEAPAILHGNLAATYLALGRTREARGEAMRLSGYQRTGALLDAALQERNWRQVDSLSSALRSDPSIPAQVRYEASTAHASVLGVRGESEAAARELKGAPFSFSASAGPGAEGLAWWDLAFLDHVRGQPVPPVPEHQRLVYQPPVVAVHAAMLGDSVAARSAVARWNIPMQHLKDACATIVEGWLDWRQQRWTAVVGGLGGRAFEATRSIALSAAWESRACWLAADGFEGLGQPDSAVVALETMIEPPGNPPWPIATRGLYEPYVRQRLVVLNVSLGRLDEARRQWTELEETCVRPDPPLAASLERTRASLLAAEGMRRGTRK